MSSRSLSREDADVLLPPPEGRVGGPPNCRTNRPLSLAARDPLPNPPPFQGAALRASPKYHLHTGTRECGPTAPRRRLPVGAWLRYAIGQRVRRRAACAGNRRTDARDRPLRRRQGGQGRLRAGSPTCSIPTPARSRPRSRSPAAPRSSRRSRCAQAAQPAWAATNPQRRARVMFKFLDLVQKEFDSLAALLSSEHGKVVRGFEGRHPARPRGGRVRLRHPASAEGRIHDERRARRSISIRCASRSASSPASRRSISRR